MDKDARAALLTAKSHVPVAVQRSSIPKGYADGGGIGDNGGPPLDPEEPDHAIVNRAIQAIIDKALRVTKKTS